MPINKRDGVRALTLVGLVALLGAACSRPSSPSSPSAVVSGDLAAKAGKDGKMDVCHRTGSGTYNLINVSANAWPAHQAHGDGVPLGPVPGGGLVFDNACVPLAAPAVLSGTPAIVDFGSHPVGTISTVQTVTVTNTGGSTASHMGGVTITGAVNDFVVVANTCTAQELPLGLAVNAACTITLRFTPVDTGSRSAVLTINAEHGGTVTANLTGTGTAALAVSAFPASLTFAGQPAGTVSTSQNILLVNSSAVTVNISAITLVGPNAAEFGQTNTCGASLAAGSFCNISAVFQPASPGAKTASLNVVDSAGSLPTVSLSGSGS